MAVLPSSLEGLVETVRSSIVLRGASEPSDELSEIVQDALATSLGVLASSIDILSLDVVSSAENRRMQGASSLRVVFEVHTSSAFGEAPLGDVVQNLESMSEDPGVLLDSLRNAYTQRSLSPPQSLDVNLAPPELYQRLVRYVVGPWERCERVSSCIGIKRRDVWCGSSDDGRQNSVRVPQQMCDGLTSPVRESHCDTCTLGLDAEKEDGVPIVALVVGVSTCSLAIIAPLVIFLRSRYLRRVRNNVVQASSPIVPPISPVQDRPSIRLPPPCKNADPACDAAGQVDAAGQNGAALCCDASSCSDASCDAAGRPVIPPVAGTRSLEHSCSINTDIERHVDTSTPHVFVVDVDAALDSDLVRETTVVSERAAI